MTDSSLRSFSSVNGAFSVPPRVKRAAIVGGLSCLTVLAILGVVAIVFRQKGYLAFNDPCIGVESFRVVDFDLDRPPPREEDDSTILSVLDSLTGGLASEIAAVVPTQATLTIRMVLEFNNTNPYDLEYEQDGEGVIEVVSDDPGEPDAVVGGYDIGGSVLEGEARSEIPLEVAVTMDLLGDDEWDLAGNLVARRPVSFRVRGGIVGSVGWAPDFRAHISLTCVANINNIFDLDEGGVGGVLCRHTARVGQLIKKTGEIEFDGEEIFLGGDETLLDSEEEVDAACLV